MGKIIFLLFSASLIFANENPLLKCNECHNNFGAPPYKKVYKHYLLIYSSKERVKQAMIDFLKEPDKSKSAMSKGMQKRFNPSEHLVFTTEIIEKAVESLIEKEDLKKRLRIKPLNH